MGLQPNKGDEDVRCGRNKTSSLCRLSRRLSKRCYRRSAGILHIQIEKSGTLAFAAYDNFYAGCVVFGGRCQLGLLKSLVAQEVIRTNLAI
jgi:hypothetical protein